jgi:hypothetical protein
MNRYLALGAGVALPLGVLFAAAPAMSHHSTAMYDKANPRSVAGVVKAINWSNPHITVDFVADAKDDPAQRTWRVEASSPGVMTRAGWSKRSLNPGDKATFQVAPLRNGQPGGEMRQVTLADGKTLTWSFRAGEKIGLE